MKVKKLTEQDLPAELPAEEPDPYIDLDPATLAPVVSPPAPAPAPDPPSILAGLGIGCLVHYVLTLGHRAGGTPRAAIINKVHDTAAGLVDLTWFTTSDDTDKEPYDTWQVTTVPFDPTGAPGTWHWPEKV